MVEVHKKDGESSETLIRRFTKKVQQSGVLIRAKKGRFFVPDKTKREVRLDAQRRKVVRAQRELLRKLGKLEEFDRRRPRRRR